MSRVRAATPGPRGAVSRPGERGLLYRGVVGQTYDATDVDAGDYLADRARFDSEGDWAFCRFSSERIPAVRFGFQHGSFNIDADERDPDPDMLQLHLEVMTADGGLLWVPTGSYDGGIVESSTLTKDIGMASDGFELLRISGWPNMSWVMRSDDDELEVKLELAVGTVTVLPDCILPHAVFSMWETIARARGTVRVGSPTEAVEGHAFHHHVRVVHGTNAVAPRRMYIYTTLGFDDGSGMFGYWAIDDAGQPIDYYCFGVHVDAQGIGTFLAHGYLDGLSFDADGLPSHWRLDWQGAEMTVEATIDVQGLSLKRGWGGPMWPRSRREYSVFPLVLDAQVRIRRGQAVGRLQGRGLAEYYDAETWRTP